MALDDVAQAEMRAEVRKKLRLVKASKTLPNGKKLTNQAIADVLGVSRQTLDLYINMKTTPRPYVLYNACKEWGIEFEIAGRRFGIKDFEPAVPAGPRPPEPVQQDLLEALAALGHENVEIETKPIGSTLEVKILIRFAG
jgi:transcriptional regulator with XRE-family HTH domain